MPETLLVFDTETGHRVGKAEIVDQNLHGPAGVTGWKDVLDCRHPPYVDRSVEQNCEFAAHVRKPFILVASSQVDEDDEIEQ